MDDASSKNAECVDKKWSAWSVWVGEGGKLRRQGQTNLHRSLSQYYVSRTVQGELSIVHPVIVSEKLDNINNRQRKQILKSFFLLTNINSTQQWIIMFIFCPQHIRPGERKRQQPPLQHSHHWDHRDLRPRHSRSWTTSHIRKLLDWKLCHWDTKH